MDHTICRILQVVFAAASSQISVSVPVSLKIAVHSCSQKVATDVELPILVKQRLLNVLLDDVAAAVAIHLLSLYQRLYVIQVATHLNTTASVCILSRLDNPKTGAVLRILFEDLIVAWIVEGIDELLKFSVALALFYVIR